MLDSLNNLLDVEFLVTTFGYPGIFAVVFAETGLMLGFFLPGDSLLITAGILASKGLMNIVALCILLFIAATLGNIVGYFFGQKVGKRLFNREDSILFHKKHLLSAQQFYAKHGGKAIVIARFMPIIRTFAPIAAGIADMSFRTFLFYNILGSLLWAVGLTVLGFYLGRFIPEEYFELIIILIIIISISPALYHSLKTKEQRGKAFLIFRNLLSRLFKHK